MKQKSLEIMRHTCAALPDRLPTSTAQILQEKLETFPSEMLEVIAHANIKWASSVSTSILQIRKGN